MASPCLQSIDFDNVGAMNVTVNSQNLYDNPNVGPTEATSRGNTTGFQAPPSATSKSFAPSGNFSTTQPHRISISIDNESITESARSWSLSLIDSDGTSFDQFVKQTGMRLTISNHGISNTINRDISQACLIMNTALLATGNLINTNVILEFDYFTTTVNSSAILSANTTDSAGASIDQFVE
ncbi:hypothetical protein GIB67_042078 [Kingdonia uniflora]|uniref:Uncharacterized protein n=1 Tax=Kingdonia uniflora TaxID=39325 RepID=A0A7J7MVZ8_9MAGN|nr:hypothetical protein GIB67_042078 [Kingdonia uniflora]